MRIFCKTAAAVKIAAEVRMVAAVKTAKEARTGAAVKTAAAFAAAFLIFAAAPRAVSAAPVITPMPPPSSGSSGTSGSSGSSDAGNARVSSSAPVTTQAPVTTSVPVTTQTPRPRATPWNQLHNEITPKPSPTADPMIQQSIRENVEKASVVDIGPTPRVAARNRVLSFSEAAKAAVEAAKPGFRNLEIARQNTQKQIDTLRSSVNMAITALETDDRYLELKAAEELWEERLEPDLRMEYEMYRRMHYEELTSDERRELISVRDMGYERFNFNIKKIDYNMRIMEKQLHYAAYAQYAGIAKLQAAVGIQEDALALQKQNLDILNAKYELGAAARVETENAGLSYQKAEIELRAQRRSMTSLVTGFNNLIGENLNTTYRDFDRTKLAPAGRDTPIATYLERALAERGEILTAAEEMDLSRRQAGLYETEITNFSTLADKQEAVQTAQEAEIAYELALQDVEADVRNAYKELVALRGSLAYNEAQVESARENYDRTQTLFELGLATAVTVDQTRLALSQARMGLENVRIDIWLQRQKLGIISGIGPGNL